MHRRVGHVGRPDRDFAGRSDDLDRSDTVAERTFVRIVTLAIPGRVAKRGEKAVVGSELEALSKPMKNILEILSCDRVLPSSIQFLTFPVRPVCVAHYVFGWCGAETRSKELSPEWAASFPGASREDQPNLDTLGPSAPLNPVQPDWSANTREQEGARCDEFGRS
jgi:hypothetical protein